MALTEAEKRKLLRERRAEKIKNGGSSRLSKITGDRIPEPEVQTEKNEKATPEVEEINPLLNRRISRAFDDRHKEETPIKPTSTPAVDLNDEEEFEKELQKIQAFLHKEQEHSQHKHIESPTVTSVHGIDDSSDDQFNPFGDQFAQLQALLNNGNSNSQDLESFLNGNSGASNDFKGLSAEEIEYNTKLKAYNKQQNGLFKAKFLLIKFILVTILTTWSFFNIESVSESQGDILQVVPSGISLPFKILTTFEILTTFSIFLKLSKTPDDEYDYKLSSYLHYLQYIPNTLLSSTWKQRIRLSVKYLEVLQCILFDLGVIVIVTGILSVLFK